MLERIELYHFGQRDLPLLPVADMTERPVWWFNKRHKGRMSNMSAGRKLVLQLVPILSLSEVGELLGVSAQTIANIERVALGKIAAAMTARGE